MIVSTWIIRICSCFSHTPIFHMDGVKVVAGMFHVVSVCPICQAFTQFLHHCMLLMLLSCRRVHRLDLPMPLRQESNLECRRPLLLLRRSEYPVVVPMPLRQEPTLECPRLVVQEQGARVLVVDSVLVLVVQFAILTLANVLV